MMIRMGKKKIACFHNGGIIFAINVYSHLHMLRSMERTSKLGRNKYIRARHTARRLVEGIANLLFIEVYWSAIE